MFYWWSMPLPPPDPFLRLKARGASTNAAGRFEPHERSRESDGWEIAEEEQLARTEVSEERPRSVINRINSPDLPFDRSINPYRGCEHGCIYCFARPSHAYLGFSAGLDFETKLIARPLAPEVLARELSRKSYKVAPIAIGTNTDPYQPIEKRYRIMRRILEVLHEHRHPVSIVTKGTLIERDVDILGEMGRLGLAQVGITITTLDPNLSRAMEPRVPVPARRLQTIHRLAETGCPVRVMVAPVVPALTDHELERILAAAHDAGAVAASSIMLRLPREVAPLFRAWLEEAFPDRARRVMGWVRELHGGRDYDPEWGKRMTGEGPFADLMRHRYEIAVRRLGLVKHLPKLRTDLFAVPDRSGTQLSLL